MGSFGERLRDAMISRGVSVSKLARACGVSRQTVAGWFRMQNADLSGEHLVLASEVLNLRIRWLARGFQPMLPAAPEQERQARLSAMSS